jgi:hypothetical protein
LNELKIRELRRQLPAKVLKPLEAGPKSGNAKNRQSSVGAPSKSTAVLEPMALEETGRRGGVAASHNQMNLRPPVPKSTRKAKSRGGSPAGGEEVDKREYVD